MRECGANDPEHDQECHVARSRQHRIQDKTRQQAGGSTGASGAAVFASAGCGGCHAFKPAGSNGAIGPNLDNVAADAEKAGEDPAAYVRESIVNPNAVLASGYSAGVMPGSFSKSLSPKEIDALVTYLTAAK